jgi:hypothetical protein
MAETVSENNVLHTALRVDSYPSRITGRVKAPGFAIFCEDQFFFRSSISHMD